MRINNIYFYRFKVFNYRPEKYWNTDRPKEFFFYYYYSKLIILVIIRIFFFFIRLNYDKWENQSIILGQF